MACTHHQLKINRTLAIDGSIYYFCTDLLGDVCKVKPEIVAVTQVGIHFYQKLGALSFT